MISQILFVTGASIIGSLGLIHLIFTFFSNKFDAHNSEVTVAMKSTSPVITKETTVWLAWVGFNASHSLGAIFFAAIYIPLSISHMPFIVNSGWFSVVPSIISFSYLLLAQKYWFKIPFLGFLVATICFVAGFVLVNT